MSLNTYSPSEVTLAFGGYILAGWNTISIKRNTPGYTPVRGIRGKNTRVRNTDSSATITFSCLQTEEANDILSQVHSLDLQFGTARLSITLKDNFGSSLFHSNEAYITSYPETVFSDSFEYRVWEIFCSTTEADWTVGGNLKPDTKLYDSVVNFVGDNLSGIF